MFGIIDVGSSSVRLLVAQVRADGSMRVVAQDRLMTRLGDGLAAKGRLDKKAADRSLEAIESMAAFSKREGAEVVRAFATAAVREAKNGSEFVERVLERAGLPLQVLDAGEEARLAYQAVASVVDLSAKDAVVFDLGGGSLQVVHSRRGVIVSNASMPLGAVRTHRLFAGPKDITPSRARALARHARETMARGFEKGLPRAGVVVGVGGSLTTLGAMAQKHRASGKGGDRARGEVGVEEVRELIDLVQGTPMGKRTDIPGLPGDRSDVILPGLIVVESLLKHLGVGSVLVSDVGLREGLVLKLLKERGQADLAGWEEVPKAARLDSVRQFAVACGYEAAHGEHVAGLALQIYDQLAGMPEGAAEGVGSDARERLLLEAAAIAHDVGIAVEYRAHHKHSYAMIANAEWSGWSREEQTLAAVIARYHRKAEPSKRHAEFQRLGKDSQMLVQRLAGILRVADGLDRSHTQAVRRVDVSVVKGRVVLTLDSAGDVAADVSGSRAKSGLFEVVFGRPVRYVVPTAIGTPAVEVKVSTKGSKSRRRATVVP